MAFTPTSTVYLLDTPLDNKYKNQIDFVHQTDQLNYFRDCRKHSFENVSYQRKDNVMRVKAEIDDLWDSNYIQYQNSNFNTKWFYAFIVKMVYVSANVTDLYIETDVYQTWMFECRLKDSFVIREHVDNDAIGLHLIDEQLEIGDYKMGSYAPVNKMGVSWNVLAVSDNAPMGNTAPVGNIYGNVITGLAYYPFPNNSQGVAWLKETIAKYAEAGKPDAIIMIFTVPHLIVASTVDSSSWFLGDPITTGEPYGMSTFSTTKNIASLDGYIPKNKKLHTYPYKFLYLSNNSGQSASYRYEDFTSYAMEFMTFGSVMPNPQIMLAPTGYKGAGLKYEYGLTLSGFPLGSWTSDAFTAWFAQNGATTGIAVAGSAVAVIAGIATANPLVAIGGVMGVFSEMAQFQKAIIQPDQAKGQLGSGSLHFGDNSLDFYYAHMTIKHQYAEIIDNFLTMYGYKINSLKVPETRSRYYWNYVKTVDVNIDGTIPDEDMSKLKTMYNEGVTLWHDPLKFLDYSYNNLIGDLYQSVPTLVSATTDEAGSFITLTFSEKMRSPENNEEEFSLLVNNETRIITVMQLQIDTTKVIMHYTPAIQQLNTIKLSYTKGTLLSADKGILESFTNRTVINAVPIDPVLLTAVTSTNGSVIVLTFDKNMIDPIGSEYEFEIKVDGVISAISSIEQDSESAKYIITMTTLLAVSQIVTLGYTRGTIKSADNGILRSFYGFGVTNNTVPIVPHLMSAGTDTAGTQVILTFDKAMSSVNGKQNEFGVKTESVNNGLYQKWDGYPDSPVLSADYINQLIWVLNSTVYLLVAYAPYKFYKNTSDKLTANNYIYYTLTNGNWTSPSILSNFTEFGPTTNITQANNPIYTDSTLTTVMFAKTTSDIVTTQLALSSSELDTNDNKNIILSINADTGYQKWNGLPNSSILSSTKPYQCIGYRDSTHLLYIAQYPLRAEYLNSEDKVKSSVDTFDVYVLNGDSTGWVYNTTGSGSFTGQIQQSNHDIMTEDNITVLYFAKTTTPTSTSITNGQTVKTSYTKGTVTSADSGVLESYIDEAVTNNVVSLYQQWSGYPQSPQNYTLNSYPYQCIANVDGYGVCWIGSDSKLHRNGTSYELKSATTNHLYWSKLISGNWDTVGNGDSVTVYSGSIYEANYNIYTDLTLTAINFTKTTP